MDELTLRTALHRAATVTPTADLALHVDHRISVHERQAARRRRTVAGALAAFVVAAGIVAVAARNPGDGTPTVPASPRTGVRGWAPLSTAPIGPRYQHDAVWTGSELLVLGGEGPDGDPAHGAAAYDPAAGTWRRLADPGHGLNAAVSVWTGTQVLAVAQDGSLHGYDLAADDWRELAHSPWGGSDHVIADTIAVGVWTGSELLVAKGRDTQPNGDPGTAAAYDPVTDEWRVLPGPPVAITFPDAAWTGGQLLVSTEDGVEGREESTATLWSFDLAEEEWAPLPDPPLSDFARRHGLFAAWTGTEWVVGGGTAQTDAGFELMQALTGEARMPSDAEQRIIAPTPRRDVAAYDLATGAWRSLPDAPVPVIGIMRLAGEVWTGSEVVAWQAPETGWYNGTGRPVLLDPASGTWRLGPPSPDGGRADAPAVWTGSELLWWSGEPSARDSQPDRCCDPELSGSSFTP